MKLNPKTFASHLFLDWDFPGHTHTHSLTNGYELRRRARRRARERAEHRSQKWTRKEGKVERNLANMKLRIPR